MTPALHLGQRVIVRDALLRLGSVHHLTPAWVVVKTDRGDLMPVPVTQVQPLPLGPRKGSAR